MKRIFMSTHVTHRIGFEPVIHTPELLLDPVRAGWRAARPLVEWAE